MRTGWYRSVHVKSLDAHRTRALLGARAQLVSMTTRLSNHIRGVLKTFGMLPGAMRGLRFDRRVEALLAERDDLAAIVRPMLTAWRQLREQIAIFDKAVRAPAKKDPTCRLLMSVPGIGVVTVLASVDRSGRISRCGDTLVRTLMYEAAVVILSRVKKPSGLKDWAQAIAKRSGIGKARVALARKLCVILHSIWRSGEPFRWSAQPAGV